ncbi:MAG: hypothetical protein WBP11_05495 [Dokdonella sp.]
MKNRIFNRCVALRALPLLLVGLCLATTATSGTPGVTVFNVSNSGATSWIIDGVANPPLTLVRGRTYQFALQNISAIHPFYINTTNTTGAASQFTTGVTNNGATGNTVIEFVVPVSAPDPLFYNCGNHASMNGTLTIINDPIFAAGFDQ